MSVVDNAFDNIDNRESLERQFLKLVSAEKPKAEKVGKRKESSSSSSAPKAKKSSGKGEACFAY